MEDLKLYPVHYDTQNGLAPKEIKNTRYYKYNSKRISYCKSAIREIYETSTGKLWLHIMVIGIGHYIAPLTKEQAEYLMVLNKMENSYVS